MEKIASILAQVMLINKGMKTIFENHGGCEKSFIDTDCTNQKISSVQVYSSSKEIFKRWKKNTRFNHVR